MLIGFVMPLLSGQGHSKERELEYGDWICDVIVNWVGMVEGEEVQRPT